jgi:hypothetical protein
MNGWQVPEIILTHNLTDESDPRRIWEKYKDDF